MAILPQTILLLLLSLLTLTLTSPTPADLVPRACSTLGSSNVSILNKTAPNAIINGKQVELQRSGGVNADSSILKSVVSFTYIPAGATGCQLQINIPKFPTQQNPNGIATGDTQADIWTTRNPPRDNPYDNSFIYGYSWNSPPVKDSFVSTTVFTPGSPTQEAYKTILWAGNCRQTMSFQVELSKWQAGAGRVSYFDTVGGKVGLVPIGFSLIFDC